VWKQEGVVLERSIFGVVPRKLPFVAVRKLNSTSAFGCCWYEHFSWRFAPRAVLHRCIGILTDERLARVFRLRLGARQNGQLNQSWLLGTSRWLCAELSARKCLLLVCLLCRQMFCSTAYATPQRPTMEPKSLIGAPNESCVGVETGRWWL
jgi:hypothetical protein